MVQVLLGGFVGVLKQEDGYHSDMILQIHDELNISVESKDQAKKVIKIMEEAVQLEVPNKVDDEYGKHWGAIE